MKKIVLIMSIILLITMSILFFLLLQPQSKYENTVEGIKQFLIDDQTNLKEYIHDKYVCHDYAMDVVSNARAVGLDADMFNIHFSDGSNVSHAIVVFHSKEKEIYVDVTECDEWAYIDFNTGEFRTYDIRTGKLVYKNTIDYWEIAANF